MNKTTIWSQERLQWLFSEVKKHAGEFNFDTWGKGGVPSERAGHMLSNNAWLRFLDRLYSQLPCDGLDTPKSPAALLAQVKLVCETTLKGKTSLRSSQIAARQAAYTVGFITEKQIRTLERISQQSRQPLV